MKDLLKNVLKGGARGKAVSYDEAKDLARHEDTEVRRELATRNDVKPELLYFLAEDPSPAVRLSVASNETTPSQADLLLARDEDQDVRSSLAEKIARIAPGLTADEQDKVRRMTYEALEILAHDQVTRVRQILSEALKDVVDAPPELIRRLAKDVELVVAGPVLQFSPVLTDEDLIEIIGNDPIHGALAAISSRAEVSENISDALVAADESDVIAALLSNPSAQIREETLDSILDRATDEEQWHAPLVKRPVLPPGAATRLARFVTDNLLTLLIERKDLDSETASAVRLVVERRLKEEASGPEETPSKAGKGKEKSAGQKEKTPLNVAKDLHKDGKLDEANISQALKKGERDFVIAALSVLAKVKMKTVRKIVSAHSAKGLVALSWKAGLSMDFSVSLQKKLARIQPAELLKGPGGRYPLTEEEMNWQLEFLGDF